MVLQAGRPVPVWGWAAACQPARIRFRHQTVETTCGEDGRFVATLGALAPGGPDELSVACGAEQVVLRDVLAGEVWLCSGQSNMNVPLRDSSGAAREIASARHPSIRLFKMVCADQSSPQKRCEGTWLVCTPETAPDFPAVAYHLGRTLHGQLDVPIGLIVSAVGGTTAEAWIPREALATDSSLRRLAEQADDPGLMRNGPYADAGNAGAQNGWAEHDLDDADWPSMPLPRPWQVAGVNCNGAMWYRRTVHVPRAWAGQDLRLSLGCMHDFDATYFNGRRVGGVGADNPNAFQISRMYTIPGCRVRPGRNSLASRIFGQWGYSGMMGPGRDMWMAPAAGKHRAIRLSGPWRYRMEQALAPRDPILNPLPPTRLFNHMIAPLIPFALAGIAWYQGESNAGRGVQYAALMRTLIGAWRQQWGRDDLPFLMVLLANHGMRIADPCESLLADLRESQMLAARLPNVAVASAIDVGDAQDVHPRNKRTVGRRLAQAALRVAYGRDIVHNGPTFESAAPEVGAIRLFWRNPGGGLVAKGGRLKGFAIAGSDRAFAWADAVIDGQTVVVRHPCIPSPVAVRYAWADNPDATLYNREGFPANPFRTDTWPTLTSGRE